MSLRDFHSIFGNCCRIGERFCGLTNRARWGSPRSAARKQLLFPQIPLSMSSVCVVACAKFDYAVLDPAHARSARVASEKIRGVMRRTVENLLEIGNELIAIKRILPHGRFGEWLAAEFGWRERMARHFMNVAERFKSAKFAEIDMDPSAAYLLAAPSTPEQVRKEALTRAENGERVTHAVATKLVAAHKNSRNGKAAAPSHARRTEDPAERVRKLLKRERSAWPATSVHELAHVLREFLAELEKSTATEPNDRSPGRRSA